MDTKKELADFITNNGIIGVTSGVVIGLVSKDVILSLVQDIVIPIIVILLLKLKIKKLTAYMPNKDNGLNITKFISAVITWILAIICTFIFVQYAFVKLIGAKSISAVSIYQEKQKQAQGKAGEAPTQVQAPGQTGHASEHFQNLYHY
uniref:Uncharacterized protein n=1 Tax=viral metagenome TaxID=1070528 RepID=A0A6C0D0P1_9ZZZZ